MFAQFYELIPFMQFFETAQHLSITSSIPADPSRPIVLMPPMLLAFDEQAKCSILYLDISFIFTDMFHRWFSYQLIPFNCQSFWIVQVHRSQFLVLSFLLTNSVNCIISNSSISGELKSLTNMSISNTSIEIGESKVTCVHKAILLASVSLWRYFYPYRSDKNLQYPFHELTSKNFWASCRNIEARLRLLPIVKNHFISLDIIWAVSKLLFFAKEGHLWVVIPGTKILIAWFFIAISLFLPSCEKRAIFIAIHLHVHAMTFWQKGGIEKPETLKLLKERNTLPA